MKIPVVSSHQSPDIFAMKTSDFCGVNVVLKLVSVEFSFDLSNTQSNTLICSFDF